MSEELKHHTSRQECKDSFLKQFEDASRARSWLAIVWTEDPVGTLNMLKTSCNFNTNAYYAALRLLKQTIDKELGLEFDRPVNPTAERLPLAPHLQLMDEPEDERAPEPTYPRKEQEQRGFTDTEPED